MALILSKETPMGVNAEYWKITNININIMEDYLNIVGQQVPNMMNVNNIRIVISGFLNKAARENNKRPLDSKIYLMNGPITFGNAEDLRLQIYTYLKTLPDWATATDDL